MSHGVSTRAKGRETWERGRRWRRGGQVPIEFEFDYKFLVLGLGTDIHIELLGPVWAGNLHVGHVFLLGLTISALVRGPLAFLPRYCCPACCATVAVEASLTHGPVNFTSNKTEPELPINVTSVDPLDGPVTPDASQAKFYIGHLIW